MKLGPSIFAVATRRFLFGSGLFLLLFVVGLAVPLGTAISAQELRQLQVVYAAAPAWPSLDKEDAVRPGKDTVLVKVKVDGFGNVVETKLLTRRSIYCDSALHAAQLWKFAEPVGEPPDVKRLNGMTATLKFSFELLPIDTSIDETGVGFIPPYEVHLGRLVTQKQ